MYSVHVVIFISNHRVIFGIAFSHFLSFHLIRNNKMPLVDDFFIQFNRLRFLWSFSNYIWLNKEKDLRAQTNKPQMYETYGRSLLSKTYYMRFGGKYKSIQTKWWRKSQTDISNWLNQFYDMNNRNRAIWRIRIVIAMFVFDNAVQLKELQWKMKTKTWIIHATIARNQPNGIIIHRSMRRKRRHVYWALFLYTDCR